jgi:hypothetical protein
MPSSTLDALLERYQQVSAANQSVLRHFTTVAAALQRAQIPFVVLKGADVISRLYGLHGTRPLADVDLLVNETDLAAIDTLTRDSASIWSRPCGISTTGSSLKSGRAPSAARSHPSR